MLLRLVKRLVDHFGRNSKSTPHFNGEMTEIMMTSEYSANHHQKSGVDGCHNNKRTNPVRPRTIFQASFQSQTLRDCWTDLQERDVRMNLVVCASLNCIHFGTHQHHRRRSRDSKHCADEHHLAIPSECPPLGHCLGPHKPIPKWGLHGICPTILYRLLWRRPGFTFRCKQSTSRCRCWGPS
jgi:hypothetical protein